MRLPHRRGVPRLPPVMLTHSFELCFGIVFMLVGVRLVLTGFTSASIPTAPAYLGVLWAFTIGVGGVLLALGLLWRGTEVFGRGVERAGLYLVASGWFTYAMTVVFFPPDGGGILIILQGVAISVACVARASALVKVDRVVTHVTENGPIEGLGR